MQPRILQISRIRSGRFPIREIREIRGQKCSSTFAVEHPAPVAQVSQPAVSPISQSADRAMSPSLRAWMPAKRQTGKPALQAGPFWNENNIHWNR
jgi:hypothetical protein